MPGRAGAARLRAGVPLVCLSALVLAVGLAGCGGSSGNGIATKAPAEILAASRAAAMSATSVHVVSNASQGRLSFTSDLELAGNGGRARISLIGLTYEVIRIGSTLYVTGDRAFFGRFLPSTGRRVREGTWLRGSADTGRLAQLASFTYLNRELSRLLSGAGSLRKGATTTVGGLHAIELEQTTRLFTGTVYIATAEKPYPIQIIKRGRESGTTTFSGWDQSVSLAAPAKAVPASELGL